MIPLIWKLFFPSVSFLAALAIMILGTYLASTDNAEQNQTERTASRAGKE